jgi:hypothetical protein
MVFAGPAPFEEWQLSLADRLFDECFVFFGHSRVEQVANTLCTSLAI